jgi:ketosteroid isomerase-like protein
VAERLLREEVVYRPTTRKRRKLDERLWALFPWLIPITTRAILRLPLESRIRRAMIRYWVQRSYEIVNRRDFDLALAGQHPDTLISWTGGVHDAIPLDLVGREFRGHEGFRRVWEVWMDAFEDLAIVPDEVTDTGDNRLLIGHRTIATGTVSGIPFDEYGFTLYTFEDGLVARQDFFRDREAAERAAGIPPVDLRGSRSS